MPAAYHRIRSHMSLATGTRLGPYEIVSRVGAGGMGEVFRARDTRLDRTVAVKILPAELARDARFRVRFQREARAISALSHPNICALYDVGESDGVDFLVMEYLEGETLAERIARGPLLLKEALRYGIDIAGALERAHREGVVHRDLKPGNVMLTRGGAKLLDFGLARSAAIETATPFDATQQKPLTAEGSVVGTFQYMAPEQLEGQHVDHRTDIFAFGAVLYEMLTGTRAFSGKTRTSLIAAIVGGTPRPISETQPVTPPELEHVVQRCLEKEPDARWQSAHDVKLELEWIARRLDAAPPRRRTAPLPWLVAALALMAAAAAGVIAWRATRAKPAPPTIRAQIPAPPGRRMAQPELYLSISPDGKHMTFGTDDDERIWLRPLGGNDVRPLEGTTFGSLPFWSPDSRWIAFFAEGKLKKVALDGSPPVVICDAPEGRAGGWSSDGVILFSPSPRSGLHRVSAEGGQSTPLTQLSAGESTHRWVSFLPDGKHFFYLAGQHDRPLRGSNDAVYLAALDAPRARTVMLHARSNVIYAAGHLLFVSEGVLVAQPFDAKRRTVTGQPFRIGGKPLYDPGFFRAAFAAADDGTLVYAPTPQPEDFRLSWWEAGREQEVMRPKVLLRNGFALSPDGRSIAAHVVDPLTGLEDIWIFDLTRGTSRRVTATPDTREIGATWSRDSRSLVFTRRRPALSELVMIDLAGGGERVIYSDPKRGPLAADVSPDGAWVLANMWDESVARTEPWNVPLRAGAAPRRFLDDPAGAAGGSFSPDGQWVLYASNPLGRPQLRVARFPGGDHQTQLDTEYAWSARWINDSEVIIGGPRGMRILPLTRQGNGWVEGTVREARGYRHDRSFSSTNDGKRYLDLLLDPAAEAESVTLITGSLRSR